MSVAVASEYLAVVENLPKGTKLSAESVSWEDYEQLLEDLDNSHAVRIFYNHGRMEIVSPKPIHERPVEILHRLIAAISDELEIDIESLGSSTLKSQMSKAGAEPDASFYIKNAALIHGSLDLDLAHDPPPDIVIESDYTSSSLDKFSIYASLAVPEIWHIANQYVSLWKLENHSYIEVENSLSFPFLSAEKLNEFLVQGIQEGERKAAKALREWLSSQA